MDENIVQGREITETQNVPDLLTGTDIGTWQAEYILREVEFERIKYGKPITFNWANSVALTSLGFGLNLLAKGYTDISIITKGEWIAFAGGLSLALTLYVIGLILPNNRKKVMKKIEKHFDGAPTQLHAVRGQN